MTFWNKIYFHYYGYGSFLHIYEKKQNKIRRGFIRGLNKAIGIKTMNKKPIHLKQGYKIPENLDIKQWKNYNVELRVKYGSLN